MEKLKLIPQDEIENIANKHKVDISIINSLLSYWEIELYLNEYYKPLQELDLSADEITSRTEDWAELCVFYHENKSAIESEDPTIFEKVDFKSTQTNPKSLKLSRYYANQIIKTYLKRLIENNRLLDKDKADEILKRKHKLGKHQVSGIIERDFLIIIGANYLKTLNVKSKYAPIIRDLLSLLRIEEMTEVNIRQIIFRS
jgi:hypothetical protein